MIRTFDETSNFDDRYERVSPGAPRRHQKTSWSKMMRSRPLFDKKMMLGCSSTRERRRVGRGRCGILHVFAATKFSEFSLSKTR